MLDIKLIRKDPEAVKATISRRKAELANCIDKVLSIDTEYRAALLTKETLEAERNKLSKLVGQLKAAAAKDPSAEAEASEVITKLNHIKAELQSIAEKEPELYASLTSILETLPNLPDISVPIGADENDNQEILSWGDKPQWASGFQPATHEDLGESLGMFDFERGVKIAKSRFTLITGIGAKLERALINFMLDSAAARGYSETMPPVLVNSASLYGTGQLPKFSEDVFKIENDDLYLIPTAEVPITNIYRDEILSLDQLPAYFCAYTPCFRSEAGSAGKDTRGIIRQHQFNKVELVKFCSPETSADEHEKLTQDAEAILQTLGLAYRKILLCTGDMGFGAAKCYDLEVWFPSQNKYREISSCSNFGDFQARRAQIRYKTASGKNELVHTINGSGLAVGRTVAAILENYQNPDGSVTVPKALLPYMGGLDLISPKQLAIK